MERLEEIIKQVRWRLLHDRIALAFPFSLYTYVTVITMVLTVTSLSSLQAQIFHKNLVLLLSVALGRMLEPMILASLQPHPSLRLRAIILPALLRSWPTQR